jgi:hypothetical protein
LHLAHHILLDGQVGARRAVGLGQQVALLGQAVGRFFGLAGDRKPLAASSAARWWCLPACAVS